jgi:hypothetical protein
MRGPLGIVAGDCRRGWACALASEITSPANKIIPGLMLFMAVLF